MTRAAPVFAVNIFFFADRRDLAVDGNHGVRIGMSCRRSPLSNGWKCPLPDQEAGFWLCLVYPSLVSTLSGPAFR